MHWLRAVFTPISVKALDEQLPVLGVADRFDRRAEHAHAVLREYARIVQREAAVERRLAAEGEQDRVDALLDDDLLDELGRDGRKVDAIGESLAGLDRGDVRVHEDGGDALFAQRLDRLRARVVELAGLADLQRAGAEHQHARGFLGRYTPYIIGPARHGRRRGAGSRRTGTRCPAGPGLASGWNCTLKNGHVRERMPSLVPSLMLTNQGSQSAGSDPSRTA